MSSALLDEFKKTQNSIISKRISESKKLSNYTTAVNRLNEFNEFRKSFNGIVNGDQSIKKLSKLLNEIQEINKSPTLELLKRSQKIFKKADVFIRILESTQDNSDQELNDLVKKLKLITNSLNSEKLIELYEAILSIYNANNLDEISKNIEFISNVFKEDKYTFRNEDYLFDHLMKIAKIGVEAPVECGESTKVLSRLQANSKYLIGVIEMLQSSKLIPFELDGETIYLSPDSAEGKALIRLDNSQSDDSVTLIKAGQEVDVHGALERLKKRGYKVKV